jgi:hypothetical protein
MPRPDVVWSISLAKIGEKRPTSLIRRLDDIFPRCLRPANTGLNPPINDLARIEAVEIDLFYD